MVEKMTDQNIKKRGCVLLLAALLAASLAACGGTPMSYSASDTKNTARAVAMDTAPAAGAIENEYAEAAYDSGAGMSYDMSYAQETGAIEEPQEAPEVNENVTERKLIKTVNISTETEQFDILMPALQSQVEQLGGYIEEISVYQNGSYYKVDTEETLRGASMTARVPKENLDSFLAQVGEQSNVVSQSERVEDVTLQYVDLDSHKRVLVSEQERLIELLAQAETVEDLIAIEGRLSEVRYQIESMESQLRTYDNKIDYSTVYLSISEVKKYTPPQDITVWQKIGNGFMNSLENIGIGIREFFIGLLINIPYIVLWAVILVMAVLIFRNVRQMIRRKRLKSGETEPKRAKGRKLWIGKNEEQKEQKQKEQEQEEQE